MKLTEIIKNSKCRPKAFILMGAPNSGKSYWAEEYIKRNKLSEFKNLNIGNFLDKEERSDQLDECIKLKDNFIFEGLALKEDRFQDLIDKLKTEGYKTFLVYINKDFNTIFEQDHGRTATKTIKKLIEKNDFLFNKFKDKFDEIIEVADGYT